MDLSLSSPLPPIGVFVGPWLLSIPAEPGVEREVFGVTVQLVGDLTPKWLFPYRVYRKGLDGCVVGQPPGLQAHRRELPQTGRFENVQKHTSPAACSLCSYTRPSRVI
jgi:hypothetical protein